MSTDRFSNMFENLSKEDQDAIEDAVCAAETAHSTRGNKQAHNDITAGTERQVESGPSADEERRPMVPAGTGHHMLDDEYMMQNA